MTIDPKETERRAVALEDWYHTDQSAELCEIASYMRALQARVTELEQDNARNAHAAKDFERAYNAAARHLSEIYGALEWASPEVVERASDLRGRLAALFAKESTDG